MQQSFRHRALTALAAMVAAALFGALIGFLLGRVATIHLTQRQIDQDVQRSIREVDRYLAESQAVLAALHASPYINCEPRELNYFRALLFESRRLKDTGRIANARILCSASLGLLAEPRPIPKPDFLFQDGTRAYRNMPPYQDDENTVLAFQSSDAYVVLRPDIQWQAFTAAVHYTQTALDANTHKFAVLRGEMPPADPTFFLSAPQLQSGGILYATRCSANGITCITAYISITDAIAAQPLPLVIYMSFGIVSGSLLGFFLTFYYRRSQGMEQQLRRAIRDDKLQVVYQPIVDLNSKRILGAEALVRWTDEDGFDVGPDVFVRVAEERGFIGDITTLVVRHALRDLGEAMRTHPGFRVNINVTPTDLGDARFLSMLEQTLSQAGVSARSLGIEITESGTARQQLAINGINQLRRRGHRVYIDDFGTGYSSLAYLQDLAIDAIKIDRAFTKAVGTGAVTVSILPQIVSMAESLKLEIIVEGIETREQASYFSSVDPDIHAQGWLFGYPFPAEEFLQLLEASEARAAAEAREAALPPADADAAPELPFPANPPNPPAIDAQE